MKKVWFCVLCGVWKNSKSERGRRFALLVGFLSATPSHFYKATNPHTQQHTHNHGTTAIIMSSSSPAPPSPAAAQDPASSSSSSLSHPPPPSYIQQFYHQMETAPCFRVPLMWGIACGIAAGLHKWRIHRASPRECVCVCGFSMCVCDYFVLF